MPKRMLQGTVVSSTPKKTVVVRVERRFTHPVLKKTVRQAKKYYAHDEQDEYSVGDIVWIEEHRPSKLKRWTVVARKRRSKAGIAVNKEGQYDQRRPTSTSRITRARRHVHQRCWAVQAQARLRRSVSVSREGARARATNEGRVVWGRHPPSRQLDHRFDHQTAAVFTPQMEPVEPAFRPSTRELRAKRHMKIISARPGV
jgi:small subunit ribosomal protein S17